MGEGRAEEQEELILNTPLSLKQEGSKGKGPWGGVRVIFTGKGKENVIPPPPPPLQRKCAPTSSLYSTVLCTGVHIHIAVGRVIDQAGPVLCKFAEHLTGTRRDPYDSSSRCGMKERQRGAAPRPGETAKGHSFSVFKKFYNLEEGGN